ncbi:uncharacterized protein LAESUDRAFT_760217 [Laetiporus sulphureus 93-53]|uniref:Uncharacterized protein n=1 Tax=Laetiporus sulphureus 93-53 TaxID=1314785 RepID=A0A165DPE6_9APHY|nr:uncharacterized protein LAESUDRAFT_760217 [Laetiporus sulphureus 93-53]KZT05328.1 hypothetical protein LAESUDRAFT_760217 [Laetiporus sulphureus 93-53]
MAYTVAHAQWKLRQDYAKPDFFRHFTLAVLRELCNSRQLYVAPTGRRGQKAAKNRVLKEDYIRTLLDNRAAFSVPAVSPSSEANKASPQPVETHVAEAGPHIKRRRAADDLLPEVSKRARLESCSKSSDTSALAPEGSTLSAQNAPISTSESTPVEEETISPIQRKRPLADNTADDPVKRPHLEADLVVQDTHHRYEEDLNTMFEVALTIAPPSVATFLVQDRVEVAMPPAGPTTFEAKANGKNRSHPSREVRIRLFDRAKDWNPIKEVSIHCLPDGNLDLRSLSAKLGVYECCQVIDPSNFKPFFNYSEGLLGRDDIDELMKDEYLCVIGIVSIIITKEAH